MNRKKLGMTFFAPEGVASSATDLLDAPTLEIEDGEQQETEQQTEQQEEAKSVAPAIDYAALGLTISEVMKANAPKPEPIRMTAEEAEKALNVWKPNKEFLAKFGNLETQEQAFVELRDGMLRYFDTVAQHRMQEMEARFSGQLAPIQQIVSEQEATQRESRFDTTYKQLGAPEMKPLKAAVIQGLAQQGALKGKTEPEIFKLIATSMEAVCKQANPAFKLTPAGSNPAAQQHNGSALKPSRSGSGGGGGGKPTVDNSGKSKAVQLLS